MWTCLSIWFRAHYTGWDEDVYSCSWHKQLVLLTNGLFMLWGACPNNFFLWAYWNIRVFLYKNHYIWNWGSILINFKANCDLVKGGRSTFFFRMSTNRLFYKKQYQQFYTILHCVHNLHIRKGFGLHKILIKLEHCMCGSSFLVRRIQ